MQFILAAAFGWTPCKQGSYDTKPVRLFDPGFGLQTCNVNKRGEAALAPNKASHPTAIQGTSTRSITYQNTSWDGLGFDTVLQLKGQIDREVLRLEHDETLLVVLKGYTRVHMDQVCYIGVCAVHNNLLHTTLRLIALTMGFTTTEFTNVFLPCKTRKRSCDKKSDEDLS